MSEPRIEYLKRFVHDVPDFPKPGILFRDITPLLLDHAAFAEAITLLAEPFRDQGIDAVLGIESRGFMFAAPLALALSASFVPVRKPGKLPRACQRVDYALEYGSDALEMHSDALLGKHRVLLIDDVIATGGTASAAVKLARDAGVEVIAAAFLIELGFLRGRELLAGVRVEALLQY